jgi:hypothetical protein
MEKMMQVDPAVNETRSTPPSATTNGIAGALLGVNGAPNHHTNGEGVDGQNSGRNDISSGPINGKNGAKCVTMAVVGAGQRGLVSGALSDSVHSMTESQVYASFALEHPELAEVVAVAEPRLHRRRVLSRAHQ